MCGQYGKHCSVTAKQDAGSTTGYVGETIPLFLVEQIQLVVEYSVRIPRCTIFLFRQKEQVKFNRRHTKHCFVATKI